MSDPSRTKTAAPTSASEPATAATVVAGGAASASTGSDAATVVTQPVSPPTAGTPTEIGGVRLQRVLGSGAMGDVWLGRHATMDIDVAVKLMKAAAAGESERFLQEVRAAARIAHPNVIQVLHAGSEGGRLFLVMELVTGGDVAQLVRREGRVGWQRAVELMIQAAEGLGAAHRAGIVHRDVKPANFLLTGDGRLKVADLGLAKQQQRAVDVDLTQAGTVMGTPAYMAPEQAMDVRGAGPQADVYALGVSLFQLLCGRLPFQAATSQAMLVAHATEPVPDLRPLAADVPEPVLAAVRQLLAKDPAQRPADGDAAAKLLRAAVAGGDGKGAAGATPADTSSARAQIIVGASVLALIVIALAVLSLRGPASGDGADAGSAAVTPASSGSPAATAATADATPPAADPWQTPTRASFVLAADAQAAIAAGIEGALVKGRLLLIERALLEPVMLKEIGLAESGRVDTASAVRAGKLVGGQVALLVRPSGDRVQLRTVVIETGELIRSEIVTAEQAPEQALVLLQATLADLPVQALLTRDGDTWRMSAGRHHGVAVGDRFTVLGAGGAPATAVAAVASVEATSATVTIDGAAPTALPASTKRLSR